MAIPAFWRINEWVKAANGYAMANGQVFFCTQPANTTSYPPTPLATLYADPFGLTPISQPLVCDGYGYVSAYVAAGTYTMVVALSNVIQNVYPDQSYGLSSAQITLETNGVPNPNQGVLNIVGAGDISVTLNALGQTVVESTGFVIPGTGNGTLVVTANIGVSTAPAGDVLIADGLGNAEDSGVQINTLSVNAVVKTPTADQTITIHNLLPSTSNITDQSLGSSTARWYASLATLSVVSLDGVLYADTFPGADIGAQVNAAYLALPSTGGTILLPGGDLPYTTPILCATNQKPVKIKGQGEGGTTLVYQASTGTAINIDTGTSSLISSLEDIRLIGPSATGSTIGVLIGDTNGSGTVMMNMSRVLVTVFGTGLSLTGGNTFKFSAWHCQFGNNGVDVSDITGAENNNWYSCMFANDIPGPPGVATNAVLIENSVDVGFFGCSFDNAQLVVSSNASCRCFGCHFENPGNTSYDFFVMSGLSLDFNSCLFQQDNGSSFPNGRFGSASLGLVNVLGGQMYSGVSLGSFINLTGTASLNILGMIFDSPVTATATGSSTGTFSGPNTTTVTALSTPTNMIGSGAHNGLIVFRDINNGGSAVFMIDPNAGVQLFGTSQITGLAATGITFSGSLWRVALASGGVPRPLSWAIYPSV
jgi:hypothetical protein